ncbi:MAG: hypothetical protein JNN16_08235 [Nitrospira sp.]|nr:hypothetical protein [Nitrospira sp.]
MSLLARVFLLILLSLGTFQFFVNSETGYAQSSSGSTKGEPQDLQKQPKCGTTIDCADKLGPHLMKYLVLSMFLEIVLTLVFKAEQVFTWLQGKTWKTPVAIGLGLLVAWGLDFHMFQNILEVLPQEIKKPEWVMKYSDAHQILMNSVDGLLLAGGNHSFYRVFTKLGIHDPFDRLVRAVA